MKNAKKRILVNAKKRMIFGDVSYNPPSRFIEEISDEYLNLEKGMNFLCVAPTSIYGENDNFDIEDSHVQAGIFRKIYLAKMRNENNINALCKDLNLNQDIVYIFKDKIFMILLKCYLICFLFFYIYDIVLLLNKIFKKRTKDNEKRKK